MKTIKLKVELDADLLIVAKNSTEKEYFVLALNDKKQVGYCCFRLDRDECKIVRIAITNAKYLSKGLGNAMFKTMENFAYQNGARYISGVFVARGYENASEMTSKFYKNQGFVPEDQEFFDREEIFKKIQMAHPEFETKLITDEKLYQQISKYNFETNDIFSTINKNTSKEPQFDL